MIRVFLLALLVLGTPLAAQSVKLKADQIQDLLSGNTVVGKWRDTPYRQYFDPDGSTIFARDGARSTLGKWRIDTERDEYQSIWPRDAEWEGWFVMEFAGDHYWVSKNTPPTPFTVLAGQQLVPDSARDARCDIIEDWDEGVVALIASAEPPDCGSSLGLSGQRARHCAWGFAYRAPAAVQAAAELRGLLSGCFGGAVPAVAGPLVNHPDSYDLTVFAAENGNVSISLKDKGALKKPMCSCARNADQSS